MIMLCICHRRQYNHYYFCNKTITTIYGNIKQAINNMIIDCEETQLIEYFSYSYFVKPKAKEIIYIILNKL